MTKEEVIYKLKYYMANYSMGLFNPNGYFIKSIKEQLEKSDYNYELVDWKCNRDFQDKYTFCIANLVIDTSKSDDINYDPNAIFKAIFICLYGNFIFNSKFFESTNDKSYVDLIRSMIQNSEIDMEELFSFEIMEQNENSIQVKLEIL